MNMMSSRGKARVIERAAVKADRRGLVVGAGMAGVAALVVAALRRGAMQAGPAATATKARPQPHGSYQLTPHVQRYYETARG
jgi:hypothetical protein